MEKLLDSQKKKENLNMSQSFLIQGRNAGEGRTKGI